MKSQTLQAKLTELNITPSYRRPRVSNDNAYVGSLFRTLKYILQWPSSGFKTLEDARVWVDKFTVWYKEEHRHCRMIGYVTPLHRHTGEQLCLMSMKTGRSNQLLTAEPKLATARERNAQSRAGEASGIN
ncbi:integrase core domain-containing protein [Citrobacter portucalensis]|uniref:integrase core domain-containing protein n=1 Tax=Citrobacter portucalensis TaxID=1639133 RepID=UPI003C2D0318